MLQCNHASDKECDMSQVIRIPANIFSRLEKHAVGFDTPANVIEMLLNNYEGVAHDELNKKTTEEKIMSNKTISIEHVVNEFNGKLKTALSKLQGKKIIFEGETNKNKSIVVVTPESKIYTKGNGWVDFTEIQINLFKEYSVAIAVFRLANGNLYYVNLKNLFPLLTNENLIENDRAGRHWKIDVFPTELSIRNGGSVLNINPNEKIFLDNILN